MFPELIAAVRLGPVAAPRVDAPLRGGLEPGQVRVRRRVRHSGHFFTIIHLINYTNYVILHFAPWFS